MFKLLLILFAISCGSQEKEVYKQPTNTMECVSASIFPMNDRVCSLKTTDLTPQCFSTGTVGEVETRIEVDCKVYKKIKEEKTFSVD